MRALLTVLMLLGALAVLGLGATSAAASSEASCHETAMSAHGGEAPDPVREPTTKAIATMACCVACVAVVVPEPPSRQPVVYPLSPAEPRPAVLPGGLSPAPEPGPPRL